MTKEELEKELKDKDSQLNNWYKEWQKQNERIAELEAQIEKMKCCGNCKHFDKLYNRCELTRFTLKSCLCNSLDKWEIKEK